MAKRPNRRVSFDPFPLLLDAIIEGDLALVKKTAALVPNLSSVNKEGMTALQNAVCVGQVDIVKYLMEIGFDVNSPNSEGMTSLYNAVACNNLPMVKFLVESGACIFAPTLSDSVTTFLDKKCSKYLQSIQNRIGKMNGGVVYAVLPHVARNTKELSLNVNDELVILRRGDDSGREPWMAKMKTTGKQGFVSRNVLGLYPRPLNQTSSHK